MVSWTILLKKDSIFSSFSMILSRLSSFGEGGRREVFEEFERVGKSELFVGDV